MSLLCRLLPLPIILSLAAAQAPVPPPATPGKPANPATPPAAPAATAEAPAPAPGVPAVTPNPNPVPTPPVPTPTPGAIPGRTPGAVPPGTLPGGPAGSNPAVPAAAVPAKPPIPLGQTKIVEPIEYPTLNGTELAGLYRKYTGRRVIVAAAAAAAEFSFVQDASPQDPLTYALAAELLRKAAAIENFVFIPDDKDKNLEILTVSARPPGIGYDVYNENDELPEGDSVVSYVMTFKHIKPEVAAQAFTQIIGQFGTYGSIAPMNGSVIITENTSLIRRLIKLKSEIDKPDDISATRFITVKYADVTELSTTLNELLNSQQQAQKSTTVQRAPTPAPNPGTPQPATNVSVAGGAATSIDTPVQIVPEPRTNRIFAMGRPVDILFVEGLIREFDIETSEKTFLRRKLRFLAVADFLPVAENALNRAFTGTGEAASGGGGGAPGSSTSSNKSSTSSRATTSGSRTGNSSSRNSSFGNSSTTGNNSFGGGGQSSFGGGGGGGGTSLGEPNVTTAPESRLVGRTLLVADNITNSIVVQGPPSGLEIVERLLDQIDVKADQVMISTVIGQLNFKDDKEYGMDYLFLGGDLLTRGGGGFGPIIPIDPQSSTTGTTTTTTTFNRGTLGSGGGLRLYGKIGDDMHVYLKALQENEDFTVLARPSIFTANNQKGVISSGERIAIPTNSNSYYQGGGSTQIQYQDVVLQLEVIPLINSEHEITLQISLLSDEVNGNQVVAGAGANGTDLVVPRITTREVLTTVTIPNNETIVLGGLITARNGEGVSGIPLLSSIPVLGKLFSTTTNTNQRSELLVFLQPSIVSNRNSLDYVQRDADDRYRLSSDTRRFADGQGVLPPVEPAPVSDKAAKSQPAPQPTGNTQGAGNIKKSIRPVQVR